MARERKSRQSVLSTRFYDDDDDDDECRGPLKEESSLLAC